MLVVVAGMKRSGTTWMFNICRLALPGFQTSHDYHNVPEGDVILKSHWWSAGVADRADVVLSSIRDPNEVAVSYERVTGQPLTRPQFDKLAEHWWLWDRVADYRMDYGDLLREPVFVASQIIHTIGSDADPATIVDQVAQLEPPDEGVDPVTFYLPDHFA